MQTLANGNASLTQKLLAGGDLAFNLFMDATMVIGVGEGLRAAYVGARIAADVAEHVAADAAEHAAEDTLEHAAEDTLEHVGEDGAGVAAEAGCGESFTASTLVETPAGERPIASLQVGDQVSAYDPATGKQTTQTVERVFVNHDHDRLDVTLAYQTPASAAAASVVVVRSAGRVARTGQRPQRVAATTSATMARTGAGSTTRTEVIHTTASHPWLTADDGWLRAGQLHDGEPVRLLDGATAVVVALRSVPGVGAMWDLSLDATTRLPWASCRQRCIIVPTSTPLCISPDREGLLLRANCRYMSRDVWAFGDAHRCHRWLTLAITSRFENPLLSRSDTCSVPASTAYPQKLAGALIL